MASNSGAHAPHEVFRAPLSACVATLSPSTSDLSPEPFLMLKALDDGDLIRPFVTRVVLLSSVREALDVCLDNNGDLPSGLYTDQMYALQRSIVANAKACHGFALPAELSKEISEFVHFGGLYSDQMYALQRSIVANVKEGHGFALPAELSKEISEFVHFDFASSPFVAHLVEVVSEMLSTAYAQPLTVDDYMDKLEPDSGTRERIVRANMERDAEILRLFFTTCTVEKASLATDFHEDLTALCSLAMSAEARTFTPELTHDQCRAMLQRMKAICTLSHEVTMCLYRRTPMSGAVGCLDYLGLGDNQSFLYDFQVHNNVEEVPSDRTEMFLLRMRRLLDTEKLNIKTTQSLSKVLSVGSLQDSGTSAGAHTPSDNVSAPAEGSLGENVSAPAEDSSAEESSANDSPDDNASSPVDDSPTENSSAENTSTPASDSSAGESNANASLLSASIAASALALAHECSTVSRLAALGAAGAPSSAADGSLGAADGSSSSAGASSSAADAALGAAHGSESHGNPMVAPAEARLLVFGTVARRLFDSEYHETIGDEFFEDLCTDLVRELHQDRRYSTVYAASFYRAFTKPRLFASLPDMKLEPLVAGCGAEEENAALATTNVARPQAVGACKRLVDEVTALRTRALSRVRKKSDDASDHLVGDVTALRTRALSRVRKKSDDARDHLVGDVTALRTRALACVSENTDDARDRVLQAGAEAASVLLGVPVARVGKVNPVSIAHLGSFFSPPSGGEASERSETQACPTLGKVQVLDSYEAFAFLTAHVTEDGTCPPTFVYVDPLGVLMPSCRVLREMSQLLGEDALFVLFAV